MKTDKTEFKHTYRVSNDLYEQFLGIFKDTNIFHIDSEYAKGKGFTDKIVHGNVLGGFLSHFIGVVLNLDRTVIASETINFHLPVYINDELVLTGEVGDFISSVQAYKVKFYFKNQADQKVASGKVLLKKV